MPVLNDYGQPVGPDLAPWTPPPFPSVKVLAGRYTRLERLSVAHVPALFRALTDPSLWTYLPSGPFADEAGLGEWVARCAADPAYLTFAVYDASGHPAGVMSYGAIRPQHGVVEVSGVVLGPTLQRTAAATEAQFLLADHAFGLGYRRYEWKCDSLNEPSRRAADRLGFRHEGRFRNAITYKGRSRDTDWFSITDAEWPALRASYVAWLAPDNHVAGRQLRALRDLR